MIKIHVVDTDGSARTLEMEANPSSNLMEILTEENFDVPAICGGVASCGTCHITVKEGIEKLSKPEDDEEFMLDSLPNLTDNSRLACQVPLTEDVDGLSIVVLGDNA
ncbi:2Fe-2S iron-sulfur cluster-binding protein [Pontibacter sp. G13]|uniref:2Fe-2S iron-sulfur cluster-binding protein n=1 Tax=Pontibacter sp. G13 TaxID=3074898 RepID=UPI00288A6040|nr:2Fe-2S iron-sulfur cluster-binding protein [Pontibacter sp. G13]WNJ19971.1 2Fe-2S iron-sulfur cluster-binding protein [Pontibacter sp. G13]